MSIYVFHVPNASSTFTRASDDLFLFFCLPDILVAPVPSVEVDRRSALTVAPKRPSTLYVSSISPQASSLTIPSISRGISPMIHLQLPDTDSDLQY